MPAALVAPQPQRCPYGWGTYRLDRLAQGAGAVAVLTPLVAILPLLVGRTAWPGVAVAAVLLLAAGSTAVGAGRAARQRHDRRAEACGCGCCVAALWAGWRVAGLPRERAEVLLARWDPHAAEQSTVLVGIDRSPLRPSSVTELERGDAERLVELLAPWQPSLWRMTPATAAGLAAVAAGLGITVSTVEDPDGVREALAGALVESLSAARALAVAEATWSPLDVVIGTSATGEPPPTDAAGGTGDCDTPW